MSDTYAPPLRSLMLPTLAVGAMAAVAGAVMRGADGLIGALLATGTVIGFFAVSHLVLTRVLAKSPELGMSAALALYLFKVIVLFGLLALFKHATVFDGKVFGFSVLAATLAWTFAEVRTHARQRVLYVQPDAGSPEQPRSERGQ